MDEPDLPGQTYGRQPGRLKHGDRVRRRIKLGVKVDYSWIITRIDEVTPCGKFVWCEVQIDFKGSRSLT